MRRSRTNVGSPDEFSSPSRYGSLRYGSSRHDTISPRSINSEGTFDRSLNTGSVIGHDDPTLVHTNIKGNLSGKNGRLIKSSNSGALDSLLTTSFSEEEIRDSPGDERNTDQTSSDYVLRQQLVELDQRQDAWRARQQELSIDTDDTVDFYLKEVGELSLSTPKKKSFDLIKEIIYEEEESREDEIYERSSLKLCDIKTVPRKYDENPKDFIKTMFSQPSSQGKVKVELKNIPHHRRVNQARKIIARNVPNCPPHHQPQEVDATSIMIQAQKDHSIEALVKPILNQQQRHQSEESVVSTDQRKIEEVAAGMVTGIISLGSSFDESSGSALGFENISAHQKYISNKNEEVFKRGSADLDPSDQTIDRTFVDVENNNIFIPNTNPNVETKNTNVIIKAVQERLFSFSSNKSKETKYAEDCFGSPVHQKSARHRSWLAVNSRDDTCGESKKNVWSSQALASRVDRSSNDEDDVDVETGFQPQRKKLKLSIMNSGLILVIIVSIICSVLLAVEFMKSRRDDPLFANVNNTNSKSAIESEPNEISEEFSPKESPIYKSSFGNSPFGNQASSSSLSNSPSNFRSVSPSEPAFQVLTRITPSEFLPSENPKKVQTLTVSPALHLGSVEEKLHAISGDSIYDVSTPQHIAYVWLVNDDPAILDFDGLTEKDLNQRYIAALLYFALDGGNWFEQYYFLKESHVCEWNNGSSRNKMGIICDSSDNITGFAINENNLRGQLPGELTQLTDMTLFQLRANHIDGTIPPGFNKLSMLEEIDLRQNELVGTIPEVIFNLPQIQRILLLQNSQLRGTIPVTIEKASNLEMISFQKCHITGSLPSEIGNLSKLFFLTFMENLLTGSIPESVTNLSQLQVLELSGNQLTGSIPDLVDHDDLYFLSLFDNKLKGTIPESLGILPKLMFLDIRNNQLDGTIPPSIGRLPDLVTLFAQNNRLVGILPSFSGNNGLLQAINLSNNKLSGNLGFFLGPDGPNERLVTVNLSENNFSGSIPGSVGLYDSLNELSLEGNSFSGTIPPELGLLREMDSLNLRENNFSGTLPEEFGLIEQLTYLNVASNRFEGTIPDTLVLLSRLKVLDIGSNHLVGSVPTIFDQLSNLDELYLNNNHFTGDLTETFCRGYTSGSTFKYIEAFAADCLEPSPTVTCKCCTICCKDDDCLTVPNLPTK